MKKVRFGISIALAVVCMFMVLSTLADYDNHHTISYANTLFREGVDYNSDDMAKAFNEKFNISIEPIPLGGDQDAQTRIWINAGTMPDVVAWNLNYIDYLNYTSQGLFKPLPEDYEARYPNIAKATTMVHTVETLKESAGDRLYTIPHVVYANPPSNPIINHTTLFYRKDWLEAIGEEPWGYTVGIEKVLEVAKKFMEQDPGGNGPGNTSGFVPSMSYLPTHLFVFGAYDPYVTGGNPPKQFAKIDGEYVWMPGQDVTLETLKFFQQCYEDGIIYKDFYSIQGREYRDFFYAEKVGLMLEDGNVNSLFDRNQQFATATGKDPNECIGYSIMLGFDGKFIGHEMPNTWQYNVFSPTLDDDKFDRILGWMDYSCTDEAQNMIRMGFQDKDYIVQADGEIDIVRETYEDTGVFKAVRDIYPYCDALRALTILPDNFAQSDPAIPKRLRDSFFALFAAKEQYGLLSRIDLPLDFYSSPNYDNLNINIMDEYVAMVLKGGDIEASWLEWVQKCEPLVAPILKELNENLR